MTDRAACIPELAGISTYAEAARIGFSVEENVQRLLRLHWAERQVMRTLVAHITMSHCQDFVTRIAHTLQIRINW